MLHNIYQDEFKSLEEMFLNLIGLLGELPSFLSKLGHMTGKHVL